MSVNLQQIRLEEENGLFFSDRDESKTLGCIGHLRGDFGESGLDFRTTWFANKNHELNDDRFKVAFDFVVNALRKPGWVLCNRKDMVSYCRQMTECKMPHTFGEQWGFRIFTRDYAIYLRCVPRYGDYNFYAYCYDKEMLLDKLANDRGLPRYCYAYLPTTKEEIRIDFAEHGYTPYRKQGNGRAAREMNRELGITPAQAEAMKAGSMFGWNVPAANINSYNENGTLKRKEEREER